MSCLALVYTDSLSLRFLKGQCEFWKQNKYEVHVFCANSDILQDFGITNDVMTWGLSFSRHPTAIRQHLKSVYELTCFFKKIRPTIVHANTPIAAFLAMIAAQNAKVPIRIYEMHGLPLETALFPKKEIYFSAEKISCLLANHVITVSQSLRDLVIQKKIVAPTKVSVMHHGSCNGIDTAVEFNPALIDNTTIITLKNELFGNISGPVVGFVGRLSPEKGIQELYQAWMIVERHFPSAKLLIVGSLDSRQSISPYLQTLLKTTSSIVWVEWKQDVAYYFSLIDFLVLPSHREGLGNVVLEAAAMKKPAVVSNVTGLKDAVVENQTGIFFKKGSVDELAAQMMFYLQNKHIVETHGHAAQARVKTFFSPTNVWTSKLALYRRLEHEMK